MVSLFPPSEPHCGHLDTIFDFNDFSFSSRDSLSHKKGSGKLDHPVNIIFWFPKKNSTPCTSFINKSWTIQWISCSGFKKILNIFYKKSWTARWISTSSFQFCFWKIFIILFIISFHFVQFQVRRRIILEPGKKDVEIIVNQVKELVSDVDDLNSKSQTMDNCII